MHMLLKIKAGNGKRHRIVLFDKHKKKEKQKPKKRKTKRKITRDWKKRDREKKKSTH